MSDVRVPLYTRLPEIYRIRDEEREPAGQLRSYLALVERAFGAIHQNIADLYDDRFIETCEEWVIPYIGDLLGTTQLAGDARTRRADVADTIRLRRRKGTLGAIALLTHNLTRWGVHAVELRERLAWHQHLNHQRPDAGGRPPYASGVARHTVVRGGTATIRRPASLSLIGLPFDPYARTPTVASLPAAASRPNLPNLAVYLWRLGAWRVAGSRPVVRLAGPAAAAGGSAFVVRLDVHPLGRPVRLFNTYRFDPGQDDPRLSSFDTMPGPIARARLTSDDPAGRPADYVVVTTHDATVPGAPQLGTSPVGLRLHMPEVPFAGDAWIYRGANLCAWEAGLLPPLRDREIAIDPDRGRVAIGVNVQAEADALAQHLFLSYTYGAVGPVGAHPTSRSVLTAEWQPPLVDRRIVNGHLNPNALRDALANLDAAAQPVLIEIQDSLVHDLDLGAVAGTQVEAGGPNLLLAHSVMIRAADGARPIVRLAGPLRFRPAVVTAAAPGLQPQLDAANARLHAHLEGLFLTAGPGYPAGAPLVARAALHALRIDACTFDPGGYRRLDDSIAAIRPALTLRAPYGFAVAADELHFKETPEISIRRSVCGPLLVDPGHLLDLEDAIVDAGKTVGEPAPNAYAVSGATDPALGWGAQTRVTNVTFFGRVRVERLGGNGGLWVHRLEVLDHQKCCIKYSRFSGDADQLPQNHACVSAAMLRFASSRFGDAAYAQLSRLTDFRIRERGPEDNAMGAWGFLREADAWRNLAIRYREFMPVGVRPILIPVT